MKRRVATIAVALGTALATLTLSGCLSSTLQHYNDGRTLATGITDDTWGLVRTTMTVCAGETKRGSSGLMECQLDTVVKTIIPNGTAVYSSENLPKDTTITAVNTAPMYQLMTSWRLGVRDSWGPFTGVDLGWAIEFPGTLEFDGRLGLPGPAPEASWRHSMTLGWGIGNWADNTWYAEYGISNQLSESALLFGNLRESILSTQISDLEMEQTQSRLFANHRRLLSQASFGMRFGPFKKGLLPKFYTFGAHFGTPVVPFLGGASSKTADAHGYPLFSYAFGLGLSWR